MGGDRTTSRFSILILLCGCHLAAPYQPGPAPPTVGADATSPDQSIDGIDRPTSSICDDPPAGVLFCDGFEDRGFFRWADERADGEVTQDTGRVWAGRGSVHARVPRAGDSAYLASPLFGPITDGDLYLRAHIYLPRSPVGGSATFLYLGEKPTPFEHIALVGNETQTALWLHGPNLLVPSAPLPLGRWVCVQLHVGVSDTVGTMTLRFDDREVVAVTGHDTLPGQGHTPLLVGLAWTDPTTEPLDVWIDEAVVSTLPIPCD